MLSIVGGTREEVTRSRGTHNAPLLAVTAVIYDRVYCVWTQSKALDYFLGCWR